MFTMTTNQVYNYCFFKTTIVAVCVEINPYMFKYVYVCLTAKPLNRQYKAKT